MEPAAALCPVYEDGVFEMAAQNFDTGKRLVVVFPSVDTGKAEDAFVNVEIEKADPKLSALFNRTELAEDRFYLRLFHPTAQAEGQEDGYIHDAFNTLDWGLSYAYGETERYFILEALQDFCAVSDDTLIGPYSADDVDAFVHMLRRLNTVCDIAELQEHTNGQVQLQDRDIARLKDALHELMEGRKSEAYLAEVAYTHYPAPGFDWE